MKIAAMYIRVSTEEQTELSPDSQIKLIRDYAKTHDYIVPDEFIFRDDGISGRTIKKRPGFNAMIGTAKRKPRPFEAVLLWKFSRFARNREDSIVYKSMLKKLGIDVISISENIGDDKMSVLIEAMIEAMDEYYSINLSEEVRRGMLEKISRGGIVSNPPIGYKAIDGQFIIDEPRAEIVRRIFAEFLGGKNLLKIAKDLNADRITTNRGCLWENRTVHYVLENPFYIGKIRYTVDGKKANTRHYRGENGAFLVADGIHEPIISQETWDKAQELLERSKKRNPYDRVSATKHDYMLRGLLKCSNCGSTLVYSCKGYQCRKYSHALCTESHYIKEDIINDAVVDELRKWQIGEHISISPHEIPQDSKKITDLDKLIKREEAKLARAKEAYISGVDSIEEYKASKAKIKAEIDRLEAQKMKKAPEKAPDPQKAIKSHITSFFELYDSKTASQTALNQALRSFVDKIVFDRANSSIELFLYY